jgi:Mrp family chromosome partitioning ATPase
MPINDGASARSHALSDNDNDNSALSTVYSNVRSLLDKGPAVLHVVSTAEGEGTSTIAQALAEMAAANAQHKTLLIKANPAHPMNTGKSLVDELRRGVALDHLIIEDDVHDFWRASLTEDLLRAGADDMRMLYGKCRAAFDLTMIDCPCMTSGRYADLVPNACDGVILNIRAETMRPAAVAHAKKQIESLGGTILGATLNRRKNYIPDFIYRYL